MLLPVGFLLERADLIVTIVLGLAIALPPTWCVYSKRNDIWARRCFAVALALCPALYVFLLRGHPWQMDMHMYFFVCFSVMILLCDPRPIFLAAGVTVLHHLMFFLLLPEWVFPDEGSLGQVLLHGFIVSCQVAVMVAAVRIIRQLTITNARARQEADQARLDVETALRDAADARDKAEAALRQSRAAEQRAEQAQRERLAAEASLRRVSLDRRRVAADEIEAGIGALVDDLLSLASDLARQAGAITSISNALVDEANGLGAASASTVTSISDVAANSEELKAAIRAVNGHADSAQRIAQETSTSIGTLEPGINLLAREVDSARDILALVSDIASQSNLLALNATIEAARSGEAGRGFAVVAGEMKQMAGATVRAAEEIRVKLTAIVNASSAFRGLIATTSNHANKIQESSMAIFAAVEQQQAATIAIAESAEQVLGKAKETDRRSGTLNEVAANNSGIARSATTLAGQLSDRAEELRSRMEQMLADMRAA